MRETDGILQNNKEIQDRTESALTPIRKPRCILPKSSV